MKLNFVRFPRRIDDLCNEDLIGEERTYKVVKEIELAAIDYENFVTDMCADRQFIEDYAGLCTEGDPMKCLLIRQQGKGDGVLVIPDEPERCACIGWAAYVREKI